MSPGSKRFAPINTLGVGAALPDADSPTTGPAAPSTTRGTRGPERPAESPGGVTTPPRHDATDPDNSEPDDEPSAAPAGGRRHVLPGRSRAGRPAPRVTEAVAMSLRVDPVEFAAIDRFVLDLRDETGIRVDKAEVIRELLRLAQLDPAVRRKLVRRLR